MNKGNNIYKLGDICTITKGNTGIMKAIDGEYTMVTLGEENKTHNEYQFDAKAVIIPLVSSTGHGHASMKRVKYMEGKFALGTILCAVIPNNETLVLAKYLQIYLHQNREKLLVSLMKGAANVGLSIKRLVDVEVLIPSMETQLKVIELEQKIIESDDKLIALFSTQQALLSNLKQSILQEAIQGKLTADWRTQNPNTEPATELLKCIKAEKEQLIKEKKITVGKKQKSNDLGNIKFTIPESWSFVELDDITQFITDGTHQTPKYEEKGRIFLSAQNVKPFLFMPEKQKFISEELYQEIIKGKKPEMGDLLIGRVGSKGETAVIDQQIDFAFYVSLGLVKTFKQYTNPQYLAIVLNSDFGLKYATGNMSSLGTSAGNFNLGRIRTFPIPLPPLSEQQAIVEKVALLMQKCTALSEEIENLNNYSKTLLKALFNETFETKPA